MAGYSRKSNESEARRRLEAFWNNASIDRPAVSLLAPAPDYEPEPFPQAGHDRKTLDLLPAYHAQTAVDCLRGGVFMAEAMPYYTVTVAHSMALPAALLGADYSYDGRTAWLHKMPDILGTPPTRFDTHETILPRYTECVRAAREAVGDMGFINPPCLMDPATTLSQLAGPEAMAIALIEEPERVREWTDEITRLSLLFFEEHQKTAESADSAPFWGPTTPGFAHDLQCDFAVMLSPRMFGEHILPMLMRLAAPMTRTLYHLDGVAQMRFLDQLQEIPQLRGIQWNPETHYGRPSQHLDNLREIRRRGLVLFLTVDSVEEAVVATRELGSDGLFMKFRGLFESFTQAEEAIAAIARAAREG